MAGCLANCAAGHHATVAACHHVVASIGDHHCHAKAVLQGAGQFHRRLNPVAAGAVGINQAAPVRSQGQTARRCAGFGRHAQQGGHFWKCSLVFAPAGEFANIHKIRHWLAKLLGNRGEYRCFLRAGDNQRRTVGYIECCLIPVDLVTAKRGGDRAAVRRPAGLSQFGAINSHGAGAIADKHFLA